jgi:hypothetical protein
VDTPQEATVLLGVTVQGHEDDAPRHDGVAAFDFPVKGHAVPLGQPRGIPRPKVRAPLGLGDRDDDLRLLVVRIVEQAGYSVDAVADGQAGLDRLTERTYDVIVSDLHMRPFAPQPPSSIQATASRYPHSSDCSLSKAYSLGVNSLISAHLVSSDTVTTGCHFPISASKLWTAMVQRPVFARHESMTIGAIFSVKQVDRSGSGWPGGLKRHSKGMSRPLEAAPSGS